jgi:hypothetical protein
MRSFEMIDTKSYFTVDDKGFTGEFSAGPTCESEKIDAARYRKLRRMAVILRQVSTEKEFDELTDSGEF